MPKLPALKPKEVVKVLELIGFVFARQRGSHKIYVRDHIGITIPDHRQELKKGTLAAIIRASGLSVKEFIEIID